MDCGVTEPAFEQKQRRVSPGKQTRALGAAAGFALVVKLILAFSTYGSNDVLFWEADIQKIRSDGGAALYRDGAIPTLGAKRYRVEPFNQPPFMVHAFRAGGALADLTGIAFRTWLRIATSLADLGILLTVWPLLRIEERSLSRLLPVALSPVLILVSGFHGNTDSLMILFLLLAVLLIERDHPAWAGASLGMAANIKIVPVIFLPVLLFSLSTMRDRYKFAGVSAAVWLAGSMPYLMEDPVTVIHRVFGYSSQPGLWGFTCVAMLLYGHMLAPYLALGKLATLVFCLLASWAACLAGSQGRLFQRCGLIAFLLMFTLTGWGVQYLVWIVPWTAALPWKTIRVHYTYLGLFVAFIYGFWSHWQFWLMNMLEPAPSPGFAFPVLLGLPLWISTGLMTWHFAQSVGLSRLLHRTIRAHLGHGSTLEQRRTSGGTPSV